MEDRETFPQHLCLLAREDNPLRCADARSSADEQCAACKESLQHLLWKALHQGDASLALALLPRSLSAQGFRIFPLGGQTGDTVFELARSTSPEGEEGDCFIVPEDKEGMFELLIITGEDSEHVEESLDIESILQTVR